MSLAVETKANSGDSQERSAVTPNRHYPDVQAPRGDRAAVVSPSIGSAAKLIEANRARRAAWRGAIHESAISELAWEARRHLVTAAVAYTRQYRATDFAESLPETAPLFLSGHQPELFHAGVWFKNFVLDRLARDHSGLSIHVLVDNDLLRQRHLLVPAGSPTRAESRRIPYDAHSSATPYEEAQVNDPDEFQTFAERVADTISGFVDEPTIRSLWPQAVAAIQRGASIGEALSEARHLLERDWGLETLEVPLSHLCQSPVFRQFAIHILDELPRFHEIYNQALASYRRAMRVRSHSHPAPQLEAEGEWLEAPFWVWDRKTPTREPLFARAQGSSVELRVGRNGRHLKGWARLATAGAIERVALLETEGIKLRPRALITTMYLRMFLSDLFLHGIGGAKYDRLTDQLMRDFWQLDPPEFMVVSATMRLPSSRPRVEPDDVRQVEGLMRQLWFHPEAADPEAAQESQFEAIRREKDLLVRSRPPTGSRKHWHNKIMSCNARLRDLLKTKHQELAQEKSRLLAQSRHDQHLASREYSFSLLPESRQKKTLLDLAATIA